MDYFLITNFQTLCFVAIKEEYWLIDFEEKNEIPNSYLAAEYESKGFMEVNCFKTFRFGVRQFTCVSRNADGGIKKQE